MTNNLKTKGIPDTIDKHVGKQLRNRRTLLGLSQEKLADYVGVTFQQVQKYERGSNRISASRLFSFSKILDVSIDYFYDGLDLGNKNKVIAAGMSDNDQQAFTGSSQLPEDIFKRKETIDLVRTYYAVEDETERKDILKIIKSMVKKVA
ncbi:MAG: helix-turn-helix domain-containing protein [Alphaproteobacteria bacterium]|nr:helix-turn-helix domain-containing protein [Alphaproteobacteria bacterium]